MDLQTSKMELIEMLISTNKSTVLKKIRAILEEEQGHLTEEDYKIIDFRKGNHVSGKSKYYTWEEAKQKIQNR